jgi:hypothetical protein
VEESKRRGGGGRRRNLGMGTKHEAARAASDLPARIVFFRRQRMVTVGRGLPFQFCHWAHRVITRWMEEVLFRVGE